MANPSKFTPGTDYSAFEAGAPTAPKPGAPLDTDLANIETSISEIVDAIGDVRRSDGTPKFSDVSAWAGTATGTANALVLTSTAGATTYAAGDRYSAVIATTNTSGTVTVNVDGIGVASVLVGGVALPVGHLQAGYVADFLYTGAAFELVWQGVSNAAAAAGFNTRALFVTATATQSWADGAVIWAAGYSYLAKASATIIPDLPGFEPAGTARPEHYGFNGKVNTTVTTADPWRQLIECWYSISAAIFFTDGQTFTYTDDWIRPNGNNLLLYGQSYANRATINARFLVKATNIEFNTINCLPIPGHDFLNTRNSVVQFDTATIDGSSHDERFIIAYQTEMIIDANGIDDCVFNIGASMVSAFEMNGGSSVKLSASFATGDIIFNMAGTLSTQVCFNLFQANLYANGGVHWDGGATQHGRAVNTNRGCKVVVGLNGADGCYFTNMHRAIQVQDGSTCDVEQTVFTTNAADIYVFDWCRPRVEASTVTFSAGGVQIDNTTTEVYNEDPTASEATGTGIPFKVNSTDSTARKLRLQDNGTDRTFLGASASSVLLVEDGAGANHLDVIQVSGATNYLQTTSSVGGAVTIAAVGTSTDIDITLAPKGAGVVNGVTGGTSVVTQDEGTPVNTATTLNFTGAGVTASDAGAGVATINIPGGGGGGGALTIVSNATSAVTIVRATHITAAGGTQGLLLMTAVTATVTMDAMLPGDVQRVRFTNAAPSGCGFALAGSYTCTPSLPTNTVDEANAEYVITCTATNTLIVEPGVEGNIPLTDLEDIAGGRILGNKAATGDGPPVALTPSEVRAELALVPNTHVISYTSPTLGGDLLLNGNALITERTAAAGISFAIGEVGQYTSTGMIKADASAESTAKGLLLMAVEAIGVAGTGYFATIGTVTGLTGLTDGAEYYLSLTGGAITTTRPSLTGEIIRVVGVATSTTVIEFNAGTSYVEIA